MDIIKRDLDKYAKGIIEGITGENLGGNTVEKVNNNYYQKSDSGSLFELLKTENTYNNKNFNAKNSKRRVLLPKGARIYGEVVDYDKKTGVTRIKTQIGYITSNKKYVKKVWQNDKWYK